MNANRKSIVDAIGETEHLIANTCDKVHTQFGILAPKQIKALKMLLSLAKEVIQ